MSVATERPVPPERAGRRCPRPDAVLLVCLVALAAFPLLATLLAGRLALAPPGDTPARATTATGPAAGGLRDLPAFTPGGQAHAEVDEGRVLTDPAEMRAALRRAMARVVGARRGRALMRLVIAQDPLYRLDEVDPARIPYPFRYPRLDRLLGRALPDPAAASDLGALLVLAAAAFKPQVPQPFPQAASVAFAVLHRARAGGACEPQLNLALLLSTDFNPRDDDVAAEFARAERACPSDPTPLWMLGQFQSQRTLVRDAGIGQRLAFAERLRRTSATFRRLRQRFPRSSAGWAGQGDAELRLAYQHARSRPFTARHHLRRALDLYRQARERDAAPVLAAGTARALAGLGEHRRAVAAQRTAVAGRRDVAPLQARVVEYLERSGRFASAAQAAEALAAAPHFPSARAFLMEQADGGVGPEPAGLYDEDAQGPLSLGADRLRAVGLVVGPGPGGMGDALTDYSFIPRYREVYGVTGHERWCPGWAARRDLVLAGRPEAALANLPERFRDIRPGRGIYGCPAPTMLAAVADLEAGRPGSGLERLEDAEIEEPLTALHDARQNLWRFAGDHRRGAAAAAAWARARPDDPVAADRAGEIAFLRGEHELAARSFGRAARLTRAREGGWSVVEAEGLLKRGTALELAGRHDEALDTLGRADELATRLPRLLGEEAGNGEWVTRAIHASYNARVQAGDTALRAGRHRLAAEHYEAAREREPELARRTSVPLARPEVLQNNQALVEARLGNGRAALEAAERAVAADDRNPLFLQTLGFAHRRAGRGEAAARAYRRAVAAEPTLYPAWNDLGVVLAERGRLGEAVDAFRRAVGVRDDYALGWFNLGVALERRGAWHVLASQGAFARAIRADERLRDRKRELVADDRLYFSALDLSKPLPAQWSYARTEERAPVAAAGLALVLLLALRLGRGLLAGAVSPETTRAALDLGRSLLTRAPWLGAFTPAAVALAITFAVFEWGLLRSAQASLASAAVFGLGVAAVVALVMRGRVLAARHAGVELRQRGWTPALLVGGGAAAAGAAWAPLPVAEPARPAPAVHWAGPVLAGFAALVLLVLGVWLEVPVTRALAAVALVVTASLLTPIAPLDGERVGRGAAGVVGNLALLGAALFMLLGLA